jgi:DNA invertase Pin-like site-specific DNA recombinase
MSSREKLRPEHLTRPALVYVRQSTPDQVRHHQESRRRQYDLAAHARPRGWQTVVVIDEDLGKSGATTAGRTGFQRLVAEVSLGRAGAVVSLEVSRLARNNRDWHQLLELCGLTGTLIVDADGLYDPRHLNDRLLLGLTGTISEGELGWLRQRAYEGLLAKARRGELVFPLPVGYVHTPDGRIDKHPDRRVQAAIERVFQKFGELGSARQVLLWFRQEQLAVPALTPDAPWGERLTWRLPIYTTILNIRRKPVLRQNPAGAQVVDLSALIRPLSQLDDHAPAPPVSGTALPLRRPPPARPREPGLAAAGRRLQANGEPAPTTPN